MVFQKTVLFLSMLIVMLTLNTHYHMHVEEHHDHHHIHIDVHDKASGTHTSLHDVDLIDCQQGLCILSGMLLLLVLIKNRSLFLFFLLRTTILRHYRRSISYQIDTHYSYFIPLRSILFHAPPR